MSRARQARNLLLGLAALALAAVVSGSLWVELAARLFELLSSYEAKRVVGTSQIEVIQHITRMGKRMSLSVKPASNHLILHLPLALILAAAVRRWPRSTRTRLLWWLGFVAAAAALQFAGFYFETLCHWDQAVTKYPTLALPPLALPDWSIHFVDWWRLQGRFLTLALPFLVALAMGRVMTPSRAKRSRPSR